MASYINANREIAYENIAHIFSNTIHVEFFHIN